MTSKTHRIWLALGDKKRHRCPKCNSKETFLVEWTTNTHNERTWWHGGVSIPRGVKAYRCNSCDKTHTAGRERDYIVAVTVGNVVLRDYNAHP